MTQCYQCGASVYITDHFCTICGTEHPALTPGAPEVNAAAAPGTTPQQTIPTQATLNEAAHAQSEQASQEGETIPCPHCGSSLPRNARFCGDCGNALATGAAPVAARPNRVATAALPDPIPPLNANAAPKPTSGPPPSVLPPFRASNWAEPAHPEPPPERNIEAPPPILPGPAPVPNGLAAPAWGNPPVPPNEPPPLPAWGNPPIIPNEQAAPAWASPPAPPNGQQAPTAWASPPDPRSWGAPQAAEWQPGILQGTSKAAEFQPPNPFPQGPVNPAPVPRPFSPPPAAGSDRSSQAFVQAMTPMPMMAPAPAERPAPHRSGYPRGQVITMIVAAIVTVMSALGGVIVLLLSK